MFLVYLFGAYVLLLIALRLFENRRRRLGRFLDRQSGSERLESWLSAARSRALTSYIFHGTFPILRRLYTWRSRYAAESRCPAGLARLAGP